VYVVARAKEPCAVKLAAVPNARAEGPENSSTTVATAFPVAKPVRPVVPLSAYGTVTVDPSTTAYVEPASVVAAQPVGIASTVTALVVSVAVFPSGAVTTTENRTDDVLEVGAVYVVRETECDPDVYTYAPTVPADAETAEAWTSFAFGVVSVPVSARTIELVLPAPHTVEPWP
jgi:hypothetical protein